MTTDPSTEAPTRRRSRTRSFFMAMVALAVVGCARGIPLPEPLGPVPDAARLYYDDSGGVQDSLRMVIRGEAMLREIWQQATAPRYSPPPLPFIDFDQSMVIVAAAGRMTPDDRISVDSVGVRRMRTAEGDDRDVLTVIVRTTRGCGLFAADAYPLEIVRVRRFDGPVDFIERRERPECEQGDEP